MRVGVIGFLSVCIMFGCDDRTGATDSAPYKVKKPAHFPAIDYPPDNAPTQARVQLGRLFFYDNRLSEDGKSNCSTCHVLSAAFTDGRQVSSLNANPARNAPTLANLAWAPYLMSEGGVPSLELQALAPLHSTDEMGSNMMKILPKLNEDKRLRKLTRIAYERDSIDPYVVMRALACFQRTFISGDSRYDRHVWGKQNTLSEGELRGKDLFFSDRTNCSSCHSGVFFTDHGFYNIGLYTAYNDPGRERKTHQLTDHGKFKTPTLRNVEFTAPYMHDGSLSSLEQVVAFYNAGGVAHPNKDERIKALHLSEQECTELVLFLKSLSDWNFVQRADLLPDEMD